MIRENLHLEAVKSFDMCFPAVSEVLCESRDWVGMTNGVGERRCGGSGQSQYVPFVPMQQGVWRQR